MDTSAILGFLNESLFMIIVFGIFLFLALRKGKQTVTNVILGLYLALLISIEFPYYDSILGSASNPKSESILMLIVFSAFAFLATLLYVRILPREYSETSFEGFWKKFLLATAGTVLVMAYSYHALPVTELITPGSPINYLFASSQSFFYWLIAPIIILYFV
ncbi:MAG: hypothetical protein ACI92I_000540 [Acidimicrobiales bacterium]|jgi:hypothetical protein